MFAFVLGKLSMEKSFTMAWRYVREPVEAMDILIIPISLIYSKNIPAILPMKAKTLFFICKLLDRS